VTFSRLWTLLKEAAKELGVSDPDERGSEGGHKSVTMEGLELSDTTTDSYFRESSAAAVL